MGLSPTITEYYVHWTECDHYYLLVALCLVIVPKDVQTGNFITPALDILSITVKIETEQYF